MKIIATFIPIICLLSCAPPAPPKVEVEAIKKVLSDQEAAWNRHDVEAFMQGYWQSDSLKFFNSNGITMGWKNILGNYKQRYPTSEAMGKLRFTIEDITPIGTDAFWVMGKYILSREMGDLDGHFMIIFERIDGEWRIVSDATC